MSISILGFKPNMKVYPSISDREKWEVMSMSAGKMSTDEIDHQIMYHQMVHGFLYNPMCKIESIETNEDTVIVKFVTPQSNTTDYDYSSMSMLKTKMKSGNHKE